MFEWFLGKYHDPTLGAVGYYPGQCPSIDVNHCSRVDMMHQGLVSVPRGDISGNSAHMKILQPAHFKSHTLPKFLSAEGPSVSTSADTKGKIFSFTARIEPGTTLADGVRIDWSAPPDAARILTSPVELGKWHEATGWVPTKADGQFAGGMKQSQNIIFSQPELIKRIEVQMQDGVDSVKSQFGINSVSLVTNSKDLTINR
jgi:hypothetical protein